MNNVNIAAAGLGGGLESFSLRSPPGSGFYYALHTIHCVFTGFSLALLVVITNIIWKRRTRRIATRIVFILSVLSLLMLSSIGLGLIVLRFQDLNQSICDMWADSHGFDLVYPCLAVMGEKEYRLDMVVGKVCGVFQVVLIIISDGAIIYRAIALADHIFFKGVLALVGVVGICFGMFILFADLIPALSEKVYSADWVSITFVFICYSFASNVVATGVIGLTAWKYARQQMKYFGLHAFRVSLSLRVLATLLESGLVYCLIQLVYVGLAYRLGFDPSIDVVNAIFTVVSGLYLSLVFFAVNAQADSGEEHNAIAFELGQITSDR